MDYEYWKKLAEEMRAEDYEYMRSALFGSIESVEPMPSGYRVKFRKPAPTYKERAALKSWQADPHYETLGHSDEVAELVRTALGYLPAVRIGDER